MDEELEAALMRAGQQIEQLQRQCEVLRVAVMSGEGEWVGHKELTALRKDAERYRWLRDNASCQWDLDCQHVEVVFPLDEEEWDDMDDAIDRAMAAAPTVDAAGLTAARPLPPGGS